MSATALAVALSLVLPATSPAKVTLSSLNRSLNKLRGDLQKTRAQLVALQKLHNQLVVAHNNVVGCMERAVLLQSNGYGGATSDFATRFFTPPLANAPFVSMIGIQWSVGVKNNTFCLGIFPLRDPNVTASSAARKTSPSPLGLDDGPH